MPKYDCYMLMLTNDGDIVLYHKNMQVMWSLNNESTSKYAYQIGENILKQGSKLTKTSSLTMRGQFGKFFLRLHQSEKSGLRVDLDST